MKKRILDVMASLFVCFSMLITSCMQAGASSAVPFCAQYAEGSGPLSECSTSTVSVTMASINGTSNTVTGSVMVKTTPDNRWNIALTEEEIDLLARILWLEANGESVEGQEAVVEVIFNRMVSNLFPNTLYDVLSQKKPLQFSSWPSRDRAVPTEKEYASIASVLNGETNLLRADTLFFSTTSQTNNIDVVIGGHSFCY